MLQSKEETTSGLKEEEAEVEAESKMRSTPEKKEEAEDIRVKDSKETTELAEMIEKEE
jgi:hypothetical protein